jgi:hypothetical protein
MIMANQTCSFWLDLARISLPTIMIIIGWSVVNKLTVKREKEKSRRELIAKAVDDLCLSVDKLFEYANNYHSSIRDNKLEMQIKIAQNDLSLHLSSLMQITHDTVSLANCLTAVIKLRQAISGNHFEDEHLGPTNNGRIHEGIAEASLAMKRCLFKLKYSQLSISPTTSWLFKER